MNHHAPRASDAGGPSGTVRAGRQRSGQPLPARTPGKGLVSRPCARGHPRPFTIWSDPQT
eukprot:scaffold1187_cov374-Prasinococcus_capsulatus_cf.AAC.15